MCISLGGCGSSEEKNNELMLKETYEFENNSSFELVKIMTTKNIKPSMGGSLYYKAEEENQTYIDMILNYTNLKTDSINCEKVATMQVTTDKNEVYYAKFFGIEKDNYTYISTYDEIEPLKQTRLHIGVTVPEDTQTANIKLVVDGKGYSYDYNLSETVREDLSITINDKIGNEDDVVLELKNVEFIDELLPQDTSSAYRYYKPDDSSNKYLSVNFNITNYTESSKEAEDFVNIKTEFMNKYNYDGFIVVEEDDLRGFSSYEDIKPLTTRSAYCLIEVPETLEKESFELTFFFNGKEYVYKK